MPVKYFIILIVPTHYILCISWIIKCLIVKFHVSPLSEVTWSREISGFRLCEANCNKIAIMFKQILIWLFSGVAFFIDINGTSYANWWRIAIWWHWVESVFHVLRETQMSIATELKNNIDMYWLKKSIQLFITLAWCSRKPCREDETSAYQK